MAAFNQETATLSTFTSSMSFSNSLHQVHLITQLFTYDRMDGQNFGIYTWETETRIMGVVGRSSLIQSRVDSNWIHVYQGSLYYQPKLHARLFRGNPWKLPHICINFDFPKNTVDGRNPASTSWYGKYRIIYRVLYIPSGARFLPSTVGPI